MRVRTLAADPPDVVLTELCVAVSGLKQFSVLNGVIACAGIGHPQRVCLFHVCGGCSLCCASSQVLSSRGTVASLKDFNRVVQINLIGRRV